MRVTMIGSGEESFQTDKVLQWSSQGDGKGINKSVWGGRKLREAQETRSISDGGGGIVSIFSDYFRAKLGPLSAFQTAGVFLLTFGA